MAYPNSNPAMSAALGNLGGMMLIAGGAVGLMTAINDSLDAVAEAREGRMIDRYADALASATDHADRMGEIAVEAVRYCAELEAKVASLQAACAQRQEVIKVLRSRMG